MTKLQPKAPATQVWVCVTAWEVPVLLPKPRSPPRRHHPGSPPAQLTQRGVPRGAGGAAAEQALDGCWFKHYRGRGEEQSRGKPTATVMDTQLGCWATTRFPTHWEGERARMPCCGSQTPGARLKEAGSPKQGLPLSTLRNPTACPDTGLLPLLIPTSPTGQAPHATLSPPRFNQTHFTVTTEPGTGAS